MTDSAVLELTQLVTEDSAIMLKTNPSIDNVVEENLGTFGWTQLLQAILVAFSSVFDSQQTLISIFTDAHPKWHCTDDSVCNSNSNICKIPKSSWKWDESSSNSIVSDWGLQCSSSFMIGLPASSYFTGSLIGGFLVAAFADSTIGRKKLLFLSCLSMSVTSTLAVFSTNIWVYSTLRFICGFCSVPIGTCNLILLTEKVGRKWRGRVGVMEELFFALGFLTLPPIAYMNRGNSWKLVYLCTSVPAVFYCAVLLIFVSESPRWLFMEGRYEEAISVLKTISPTTDNLSLSIEKLVGHVENVTPKCNANNEPMIMYLIKKKWGLQRLVALLVPGFCIGLSYFGMAFGVENLNMKLYFSATVSAALEIPAVFITYMLIENCSRKGSLLTVCVLGGVFGIVTPVIKIGEVQLGLQLAAFFCACTAYNVIVIYTVELFPTCVRNFVTAAVRQTIIFGAVFGPILVANWRNHKLLSYRIFGALLLFSGFFMMKLPETKGVSLSDTMDEQELKDGTVFLT